MKIVLSVLVVATIASAFVGTAVFLYQQSLPRVEPYRTVSPERRTIVDKTVATGSIVPRKEIAIKPQVRGVVEKLLVEPPRVSVTSAGGAGGGATTGTCSETR